MIRFGNRLLRLCILAGLLAACSDNTPQHTEPAVSDEREKAAQSQPATAVQPGMRAYKDPVTGEFVPAPPEEAPQAVPQSMQQVGELQPQPELIEKESEAPGGGMYIELPPPFPLSVDEDNNNNNDQ